MVSSGERLSFAACVLARRQQRLVRLCVPGLSLTGDRIGPRGPGHTVLIGPALATFPGSPTRGPRVTLSLCPGLVCVAPSGQAYGRLAAGLILPVSLALVSSANVPISRGVLAVASIGLFCDLIDCPVGLFSSHATVLSQATRNRPYPRQLWFSRTDRAVGQDEGIVESNPSLDHSSVRNIYCFSDHLTPPSDNIIFLCPWNAPR